MRRSAWHALDHAWEIEDRAKEELGATPLRVWRASVDRRLEVEDRCAFHRLKVSHKNACAGDGHDMDPVSMGWSDGG